LKINIEVLAVKSVASIEIKECVATLDAAEVDFSMIYLTHKWRQSIYCIVFLFLTIPKIMEGMKNRLNPFRRS